MRALRGDRLLARERRAGEGRPRSGDHRGAEREREAVHGPLAQRQLVRVLPGAAVYGAVDVVLPAAEPPGAC